MYRAVNSWQWYDPAVADAAACAARVQAVREPVTAHLRERYGRALANDGGATGWSTLVDTPSWRVQVTVRTWEEPVDGALRAGATLTMSAGHPADAALRDGYTRRTRLLTAGAWALLALGTTGYVAMLLAGYTSLPAVVGGFGLLVLLPLFLTERVRTRIPDPTETVSMQIPDIAEQFARWREIEKELLTLWMDHVVADSTTAVVQHRSGPAPQHGVFPDDDDEDAAGDDGAAERA